MADDPAPPPSRSTRILKRLHAWIPRASQTAKQHLPKNSWSAGALACGHDSWHPITQFPDHPILTPLPPPLASHRIPGHPRLAWVLTKSDIPVSQAAKPKSTYVTSLFICCQGFFEVSQFAENVLYPVVLSAARVPLSWDERKSKDPEDLLHCYAASGSSLVNILLRTCRAATISSST